MIIIAIKRIQREENDMSRKSGGDQTSLQCQHIKIWNLFNQEVKTNSYHIEMITGAYSGGGAVRGAPPPWIFRILRERALSLTTAIEKETKRKKYIVSGVMMAKEPPPPPLPS